MSAQNRKVMGIVNLTDNSYYAASRHLDADGRVQLDAVCADIGRMLDEGADIIDMGACSTRPGAAEVGAEEEWRRLEPALRVAASTYPGIYVSVDTYWASVAVRSYGVVGDRLLVNDVSAGLRDPGMLEAVGRLGVPYVAMHNCGAAADKGIYQDGVVEGVRRFFEEFSRRAEEKGVRDWILDPGFGFSKSVEENWELLRNLGVLKKAFPERELLVGISRKSMIYKPLGISPEEALPATTEAHKIALRQGADILRVHDVAPAKELTRAIR